MKKLAVLLLVMMIVSTVSFAEESADETVIQMAQSLLTEIYGYTQEDAGAFTYDVSDEDAVWVVRFYNNPAWVYKAAINKGDMTFSSYSSPFTTLYISKASENSVRYVLRAIAENGWFESWNAQSKTALQEAIDWCGDIRMNTSLRRGMQSDEYTPAQVLNDYFLSCYGDTALWSQEVSEWCGAVFASFGLTRETASVFMPTGTAEYVVDQTEGYEGTTICEFVGEVPQALEQAFSHPKLQGYTCLCGAYQALNKSVETETPAGTGLAAFAKGEERLLVMLLQDAGTLEWEVLPVSETALLKNRDLYIVYGGSTSRFDIVYPVSDTELERFCCRLTYSTNIPSIVMKCSLEEYCRVDLSENAKLVIGPGTNYSYADWYHVVTTQNGVMEETQYPALCSGLMEYIDASAFPKTEEECRATAEASPSMPEGYGFSSNVHLRAKATSHSDDLGMYRIGTLVEVLDSQPGVDFPWYHVRIGVAEGYMSGNYVTYSDSEQQISRQAVLGVGRLTADTALKERTGLFAGTVAELPAGMIVRVLAEKGNWLHVSVPSNEDDWLMQPGEVNGYVKNDALVEAVTVLQLDWLEDE